MELAINILNTIFLLHNKTQNYPLKYPNVLHQMYCKKKSLQKITFVGK